MNFDVFKEYLSGEVIPVPTKHIPAGSNAVMDALLGNRKTVFKDIVLRTHEGLGCL